MPRPLIIATLLITMAFIMAGVFGYGVFKQDGGSLLSKTGTADTGSKEQTMESNSSKTAIVSETAFENGEMTDMAVRSRSHTDPTLALNVPKGAALDLKCRPEAAITGLGTARNDQLRQLSAYQDLCGSRAFDQMMYFTYLPQTLPEAKEMAVEMAALLNEFASFRITPVIVVEPVGTDGSVVLFKDIANGAYDALLDGYFAELEREGINGGKIGLWAPLAEPNINEWGSDNNNPDEFVSAFNRYGSIFKRNFPTGRLTVLLDNSSYDQKTAEYAAVSLEPYLKGLESENLTSFDLQGFPSAEEGANNSASAFISQKRAVDSAALMGVKSISFNTGTYSSARGKDGGIVRMAPVERARILNGILREAAGAKSLGYLVSINLFAQDKSRIAEGIDWSYLKTAEDRQILFDFIAGANKAGITLSLFDSQAE